MWMQDGLLKFSVVRNSEFLEFGILKKKEMQLILIKYLAKEQFKTK